MEAKKKVFLQEARNGSPSIVLTGCLGFIGGYFLTRYGVPLLKKGYNIIHIDAQRRGSNPCINHNFIANIQDLPGIDTKYMYYKAGLEKSPGFLKQEFKKYNVTDVIHFAAESHVDDSIQTPGYVMDSNVRGTMALLEAAISAPHFKRFVYVSTDEVYGDMPAGEANEETILQPQNPYSASKAASEYAVRACANTYGFEYVITRGANTFGIGQDKRKLIPRSVDLLNRGGKIELYGDGSAVREWLPVRYHTEGVYTAWAQGVPGVVYNISTEVGLSNNRVAYAICEALGYTPEDHIAYIADRPGHDMRYAIVADRIKALGWAKGKQFTEQDIIDEIKTIARYYSLDK